MKKLFVFLGYYQLVCIVAILFIGCLILNNANWILGDDHFFLLHIAKDQLINCIIIPPAGRFYPLTYMEFNLLLFLSLTDPIWFYCISYFYFFVTCFVLALFFKELIDEKTSLINYCFCIFFLFIFIFSPSVLMVFMEVIFAERNLLCHFSLFMYFYWKGIKKENLFFILIASFFAVSSFYYKEPVFLSFAVFCVCPFVFDYSNVKKEHKYFSIIIFINILIYLLLYYFLVYQHIETAYNSGRVVVNYFKNFIDIISNNYYFVLILLFSAIRLVCIVNLHEKKYIITDSLLFAGVAYFFSFLVLKLNASYYFVPVYILTLPSILVFMTRLKWKLVSILFFIVFLNLLFDNIKKIKIEVKNVSISREMDMKQIDMLSQFILDGYDILYLQPNNYVYNNDFEKVICNYWRDDVLEIFLLAKLGYNYKIETIDTLSSLKDNQILIVPVLINKEKVINSKVFENTQSFFMYQNVLTVYKKRELNQLILPCHIDFKKNELGDIVLLGGYFPENIGRWGGEKTIFKFKINSKNDVTVDFKFYPFIANNYLENTGKIYVNDQFLQEWKFSSWDLTDVKLKIPSNTILENEVLTISFVSDRAVSPKELGISDDYRKLSLLFVDMDIY